MGTGFKWYGQRGSVPVQAFVEAGEGGGPAEVQERGKAREWLDEEAVAWAKEGIDGAEARIWKGLGVRPDEAGHLDRNGATLADTVRDWWQAGIPIAEVADWVGAGLTPKEAAAKMG